MRRVLSHSVVLAFAVVLGLAVFVHSSADAQEKKAKPCISKKFDFKQVEKACADGGQKAVKKLMKAAVKKAKKAGDDNASSCLNCHEDLKTFKRTANATKWLKPYL